MDESWNGDESRAAPLKPARRKTFRKRAVGALLALFALAGLYLALLRHPGLFFGHSFTRGNITLHSDRPIPQKAAVVVLDDAAARLARSPLHSPRSQRPIAIYLCNDRWRFELFANIGYQVGGLTYTWLTDNVFLRPSRIETNRLIAPNGDDVPGERTLSYYVAHEIMHVYIARDIGSIRFLRLPVWVNEGYCDYVAKGTSFSYDKAVAALKRDDPEMHYEHSGLYSRYHLRVAHLLDRREISVARLLSAQFDPSEIDREILEEARRH